MPNFGDDIRKAMGSQGGGRKGGGENKMDFNKLTNCLEIIDKNKPLQFMVHGKWQLYSHYEMAFDSTTIWFIDNLTGGSVPVDMKQIDGWRKKDASDELKSAIAELKKMKDGNKVEINEFGDDDWATPTDDSND